MSDLKPLSSAFLGPANPRWLLAIFSLALVVSFLGMAGVYHQGWSENGGLWGPLIGAFAAIAEAYLFFWGGVLLAETGAKFGARMVQAILVLYSAVGVAVYATQIIAVAQSGVLVSVVAFENSNQAGLVSGPIKYWVLGLAGILWVGFVLGLWWARAAGGLVSGKSKLPVMLRISCCALIVIPCNFDFFNPFPQGSPERAEATPFVAFVRSAAIAFIGESSEGLPYVPSSQEHPFFYDGEATYPFLQEGGTVTPVPFGGDDKVKQPNVIVLFIEGLSARTIGAYDARRKGLTPNIDAFAEESMMVTNYFSHTAATFRGIHGQLASCFPERGAWENGVYRNAETLRRGKAYRTLPDILTDQGYEAVFFSPHREGNGLHGMLSMLGFDSIYTMERVHGELLGNKGGARDARYQNYLTDTESIDGLTEFLRGKENDSGGNPFFVGLYNIGTHATFDVASSEVKFGDGSNPVLNNIHNMDAQFGRFYSYFRSSPWARNTLLVLTADHAHYPEPAYYRIVAGDSDYKLAFCDRIPLIFHAGYQALPKFFDCGQSTSLGFAPSMLSMLGIAPGPNAFIGRSIFDVPRSERLDLVAIGNQFHVINQGRIYHEVEVPAPLMGEFERYKNYVKAFYYHERYNRIFPPDR